MVLFPVSLEYKKIVIIDFKTTETILLSYALDILSQIWQIN